MLIVNVKIDTMSYVLIYRSCIYMLNHFKCEFRFVRKIGPKNTQKHQDVLNIFPFQWMKSNLFLTWLEFSTHPGDLKSSNYYYAYSKGIKILTTIEQCII